MNGDGPPQRPSRPVLVLMAGTVATPIVIAGGVTLLGRTEALVLALVVVTALAGVVYWAVRHLDAP